MSRRLGWSFWLRLAVSGTALTGIVAWLRRDLGKAWHLVMGMAWWTIPGAAALYLLAVVLVSERFRRILSAFDVELSLVHTTQLSVIGLFFNNFLPTSVGGDVVKAHCASQLARRKAEPYLAVFADRLCGLITVVALGLCGALATHDPAVHRGPFFITGVVMLAAGLWALWQLPDYLPRLLQLAGRRWRRLNEMPFVQRLSALFARRIFTGRRTISVLAISIVMQLVCITAVFVLAKGLSLPISLWQLILVTPLIWAVGLLPSFNGLGVREGAFVYFLGGSAGREGAFALSLLWLAVITIVSLLGAPAYLASGVANEGGRA